MIRGAVLAAGATGLAVGAVWWWRRFRLPGGQLTVGRHFLSEPKGLLFDVDGTLIDTMPHFLPSCAPPDRLHRRSRGVASAASPTITRAHPSGGTSPARNSV